MMAVRPLQASPLRSRWFWLSPLFLLGSLVAGTAIGETTIPLATVIKVLANRLMDAHYVIDPIDAGIIWNYRLSRSVVAGCCGAGLALAGVVLQALLRNPLADPYLMGISAGASTGAVLVAIAGWGGGVLSLSSGAMAGAAAAFGLVTLLAGAAGRSSSVVASGAIILAGIAGSSLFNALTAFVIARSASAEQARGIMFWLMGNLSGVRWDDALLAIPAVLVALLVCLWHRQALDAFAFGADSAASMGIAVRPVRAVLIATVALVTAVMVSMVGAIGFVGLVIPHAMRLLIGSRHSRLVPASAIAGAIFLIGADIVSRIIVEGQVLPIGVVTSLIGAPVFAVILIRGTTSR